MFKSPYLKVCFYHSFPFNGQKTESLLLILLLDSYPKHFTIQIIVLVKIFYYDHLK